MLFECHLKAFSAIKMIQTEPGGESEFSFDEQLFNSITVNHEI